MSHLAEKKIIDISCGLGSLALDDAGKLYTWGPNGEGYARKPLEISEGILKDIVVKKAVQSTQGICAVLDRDNKIYVWTVQKRFHSTDLLDMKATPVLVRTLRKKKVRQIFAGYNSVFALSEDVLIKEKTQLTDIKEDGKTLEADPSEVTFKKQESRVESIYNRYDSNRMVNIEGIGSGLGSTDPYEQEKRKQVKS